MRKWIAVIATVAVAVSLWLGYDRWLAPRGSYDGKGNSYRVEIDADRRLARVEADIWQGSDMLSMFDVQAVPGLPNGHIDLIDELQVRDADGDTVRLRDLGQGDYALRGGRRLQLSYAVRLEHDQYAWPAGTEEVGYWTDEGLMIGGSRLFFADGEEQLQGPIRVQFTLPEGWRANTPWPASGTPGEFLPSSRRDLLSNVMFLGTAHSETIAAGGIELTLVLGRRYVPAKPLFEDLLRTQLAAYRALFGAAPLANRYLIVINHGDSGDGGAFSGSFSQFIRGDADAINRVNWGYVMAHELLHFWNGLSLRPADHREEWFKEGVTDYLTIATLARSGLIDEPLLMKRLENVPRRYLMARMVQRLDMSVRDSGRDKQPNRLLVYGGGSLAALALDIELRRVSDDKVGLPQLMQALFAEHAGVDRTYQLADIERLAQQISGHDFRPFFANAVDSSAFFDIAPWLPAAGLRMDSFFEEVYIQRDPAAGAVERARFESMFGARPIAAVDLPPR
jgi:predicted metalloprotease with PDZ domain